MSKLLFPALSDPKVAQAVNKAIDQRNQADFQCFMALQALEHKIGFAELLYFFQDEEEGLEFIDMMQSAVDTRRVANNRFTGLISGNEKP